MSRLRPQLHGRGLAPALALAALALLASLPSSIVAAEPPRPLPAYRPAFVTEVDGRRPFKDCLWSSAAMLLDKWTSGRRTIGHVAFRALSGDRPDSGSSLVDLQRAFSRLGLDLPYSPDGGVRITWRDLTIRLAAGGGAVVAGDYGHLPARWSRWDRAFAATEPAGHALYLDGYDRRTDRIFVFDPLAPAGWTGEWMPASAVRAFTWHDRRGHLSAAMTPAAKARAFAGVKLAEPATTVADGVAATRWPVIGAPRGWTPGHTSFEAVATRLADGLLPAGTYVVSADPAPDLLPWATATASLTAPPMDGTLWLDGTNLVGAIALPTEPGLYEISGHLVDHRFDAPVAEAPESPSLYVYVPGALRGSIVIPAAVTADAGDRFNVELDLANTGSMAWAAPETPTGPDRSALAAGSMHLLAVWEPADPAGAADPPTAVVPAPIDLGPVDAAPGTHRSITVSLEAPMTGSVWFLHLDLVHSVHGSLAALGSAPAVMTVAIFASGATAATTEATFGPVHR